MTTHELAKLLLSLPDQIAYRMEPTHDYWRHFVSVRVRKVTKRRVSAVDGRIRTEDDRGEPGDETVVVIE